MKLLHSALSSVAVSGKKEVYAEEGGSGRVQVGWGYINGSRIHIQQQT